MADSKAYSFTRVVQFNNLTLISWFFKWTVQKGKLAVWIIYNISQVQISAVY